MAEAEEPFPGFEAYLVGRFGLEARSARFTPLRRPGETVKEGGYGVPYLVEWDAPRGGVKRLVLETVRPGGFGHEDRADRAGLVVRAADDFPRLPRHVAVIDAGAFRAGGPAVSLSGTGEFFLLTEFCEGEPYAFDLARLAGRERLVERDHSRTRALADYLAGIHREPVAHATFYRRRLRDLVGAGECLAGIADSYPTPCGFVTADLLRRVEELALRWRYRLRDRSDRLRTIHGDFHPWNVLFTGESEFHVLDRSRGAFGDPADDVAAMAINYLFFALRQTGSFSGPFAELLCLFWDRYAAASGDVELADVVAPHFAFRALVLANPLWYPHESDATRRALFRFLLAILEADRFQVDRLPSWLTRDGLPAP
jgi:aminoglycoside phosphotransferase (APT) family kinase protein